MKAKTTLRLFFPAWASAFLWKCTRQRCQDMDRTRAVAALMPSCASLITSFTPLRPRRTRSRRNSVQKGSASEAPMAMPSTSRRPSTYGRQGCWLHHHSASCGPGLEDETILHYGM